MKRTPFRPGMHFSNGRLIHFTSHAITVMKPWPEVRAWRRTSRQPWRPCRPKLRLVSGRPGEVDPTDPLAVFMASVPEPIRMLLGAYRQRHWHMLSFFARCPGAEDLARSNPALAFALANSWVFRKCPVRQPMRSARALVRKPQVEILDWLDFPATKSAVRLLRRLVPESVSVEALLYLRAGMSDPESHRLLRHLPRINRGAIFLATRHDLRPFVTPQLLREMADLANLEPGSGAVGVDVEFAHAAHRILAEFMALDPELRPAHPRRIFSFLQLGEISENMHRHEMARSNRPFPPPPLPETETIRAIRSTLELSREGLEMHHCIGTYAEDVLAGRAYVYRLLAPERATLLVEKRGRHWGLGDIRKAANLRVREETYCEIESWLRRVMEIG